MYTAVKIRIHTKNIHCNRIRTELFDLKEKVQNVNGKSFEDILEIGNMIIYPAYPYSLKILEIHENEIILGHFLIDFPILENQKKHRIQIKVEKSELSFLSETSETVIVVDRNFKTYKNFNV